MIAGSEPSGYERLEVYRRAIDLVPRIQDLVGRLPDDERYALANQMKRATRSIPANIAEGYAKRRSHKEFCAYLTNAMGSSNEMEVHLRIAQQLGYVQADEYRELVDEFAIIGKQLNRLITSWSAGPPQTSNQRPATSN